MSIVREKDFESDECGLTASDYHEIDSECFYCGDKIIVPFIYWCGNDKNICLHVPCAYKLGLSLYRDFMEIKYGDREHAFKVYRDQQRQADQEIKEAGYE